MADVNPLKLVDLGAGQGQLREMQAGDKIPGDLLPTTEWSADTVTQAEAEAGTATTRRAWTAERVRQAIVGWWNGATSAFGRGFVASADAAAGRTALGLGNAATRDVATNAQALAGTADVLPDAAGVHAAFKQYGYGGGNPANITLNCNDLSPGARNTWTDTTESTVVSLNLPALGGSPSTPRSWHVECFGVDPGRQVQKATEVFGVGTPRGRTFIRVKHDWTWHPWVEVLTTSNILGTVSQSAGIPTGAIIERGVNVNGEYVRYADGTQICWGVSFMITDTAYGTTGLYYSVYPALTTLPASFVDASYRVTSAGTSTNILPGGAISDSGSAFRITGMYAADAAVIGSHWIAIGRWY